MLPIFYYRNQLPSLFDFVDDLFNRDSFLLNTISSMKVDIIENDTGFVLKADLPGVKKEDINVNFKDGLLTIEVESKQEQQSQENEKILTMERSFSKKVRSFNFDKNVNEEAIKASYENGVLTLELPKKEQQESKRLIQIE
jgi:HSP20 family protein